MRVEMLKVEIIDEKGIPSSVMIDLRGRNPNEVSSMSGLISEGIALMKKIESVSNSGVKH